MPKVTYLSAQQMCICEYVFQGKSEAWIAETVFHVKKTDPDFRKSLDKIRRLKKNPKFEQYYNSLVSSFRRQGYGRAITKLTEMVDDPNPWVALQASNSVLNHTEKAVISEEENTVTVKIEGMPTLGAPTQDEQTLPSPDEKAYLEATSVVEAVESSVV